MLAPLTVEFGVLQPCQQLQVAAAFKAIAIAGNIYV